MTTLDAERGAGEPGPACSDWARSQKLAPIGTAGSYRGFLLVEQPLPWPSDVSEVAELAGVAQLALQANLRLQAIVGADGAAGGERRVICYQLPGVAGDAVPGVLSRAEAVASRASLAEVAESLLGTGPDGRGPRAVGPETVDVLVCTHGRRDMCCGSKGTDLFAGLVTRPIEGSSPIRVWRTSHTGGHRFAPTAVVLPSATLWAWADAGLLERVVNNNGPVEDVLDRYRGYALLGPPSHQAVEAAVMAKVGWPLLSSRRASHALGEGRVRLETAGHGTWEASAREGRRVAQPDCRTAPASATKFSVEWVVEGLCQVGPA